MKKKTTIVKLFILLVLVSCKGITKKEQNLKKDDTFLAASDDKNILAAMKQAQHELDYFIKILIENPADTNYWFVAKTAFKYNEQVEHMWVNVFSYKNRKFTGKLIDKPIWVKNISSGDTVSIDREKVEDWIFFDNYTQSKVGDFLKE